jgi:hypothetical protein
MVDFFAEVAEFGAAESDCLWLAGDGRKLARVGRDDHPGFEGLPFLHGASMTFVGSQTVPDATAFAAGSSDQPCALQAMPTMLASAPRR